MTAATGFIRRWAIPLAVLAAWQVAAPLGWVDPIMLPPPTAVVAEAWRLLLSGELLQHVVASGTRVLLGVTIAVSLGCTLGFLVASSSVMAQLFDGTMQALRLTPVVAAAPLLILWFGFGEASKIAIIGAMGMFPMYLAALSAFRGIDPRLIEVNRILRPGRWWLLWRFYIPAALPEILNGARYALVISWLSLAVAELIGTSTGIGHLVLAGNAHKNLNLLFVAVLLFAVSGKLTDALIALVQRRLLVWSDTFSNREAAGAAR
ncbi:ABC transporter permease [Mesorhizobium sp. CAU 1732]|uniref:ABC transporter permease n=1 Tax=Mesorhizobium sp. CAU 1732 TaxID=3140358 RepID=UPI003260F01C